MRDEALNRFDVSGNDTLNQALALSRAWIVRLFDTYINVVSQSRCSPHDIKNLALLGQQLKKLNPDYAIKDYPVNVDAPEEAVVDLLFGKKAPYTPSLQFKKRILR